MRETTKMMIRVCDVIIGFIVLVVLSPFFVLVGMLIKATSRGPIFFRQIRVGLHQKEFVIYKFRTMKDVPESERLQAENKEYNKFGKQPPDAQDDRIFSFGRFLRRTSIDELPQLLNVLRSEMSIVGPRPLILQEFSWIPVNQQKIRQSVKPGLTGIAQIWNHGYEWIVQLIGDLQWVQNASLRKYFFIILKTPFAIILGKRPIIED